jgi:hypothetical protein
MMSMDGGSDFNRRSVGTRISLKINFLEVCLEASEGELAKCEDPPSRQKDRNKRRVHTYMTHNGLGKVTKDVQTTDFMLLRH